MTVDHGQNDFQNKIFKDEWDRGAFDATALQPALLDPVDQVLLVRVVPEIHLFIHYLLSFII